MLDFEQIGETFEDGFDKVKTFTKKNKIFTIAIIGVAGFALYKFFTGKQTSEDTEYVSTYAYVPTAYDGYPTMSESVSYDDVLDYVDNMGNEFYNETMSSVSQLIESSQTTTDKGYPNIIISGSSDSYDSSASYIETQRQNIIDQMQSNSEAWHNASPEEKERLHNENLILGSSLGANFDSASGAWYKDGESLYSVSEKNKTNTSTSMTTSVGAKDTSVSQEAIVAQMQANSEAWHSATTQEEKDRLHEENKRLGTQLGANFDGSSGSWSSNGKTLYTVNTSSSTSSGSKTSGSTSSGSTVTVTSIKANSDGTYTHTWSNGKTSVQTQKNGGLVLSTY